jgi:hypothetical protein
MSISRGKFWVLLLPMLAAGGSAMATEAATCPVNHTDVRISRKIEEPRIDYSKRETQLETMKFRDTLASDRSFAHVAGLTVASIAVDSEIRIASSGNAGGEPTCAWPTVVTVTLSTAPTVYVGADHGDCLRDVGLGHEMEHVAIDRNVIDFYSPIFRRQINAMIDAMNSTAPSPGLDVQSWRQRIEEKINAVISVQSDALNFNRAARHRILDSPEEYRRLSVACPQVTVNPSSSAARARMPVRPDRLCLENICS